MSVNNKNWNTWKALFAYQISENSMLSILNRSLSFILIIVTLLLIVLIIFSNLYPNIEIDLYPVIIFFFTFFFLILIEHCLIVFDLKEYSFSKDILLNNVAVFLIFFLLICGIACHQFFEANLFVSHKLFKPFAAMFLIYFLLLNPLNNYLWKDSVVLFYANYMLILYTSVILAFLYNTNEPSLFSIYLVKVFVLLLLFSIFLFGIVHSYEKGSRIFYDYWIKVKQVFKTAYLKLKKICLNVIEFLKLKEICLNTIEYLNLKESLKKSILKLELFLKNVRSKLG